MKAGARLCECGRKITYFSKNGFRKSAFGGHHLCRQCWKEERDRSRPVKEKGEALMCPEDLLIP